MNRTKRLSTFGRTTRRHQPRGLSVERLESRVLFSATPQNFLIIGESVADSVQAFDSVQGAYVSSFSAPFVASSAVQQTPVLPTNATSGHADSPPLAYRSWHNSANPLDIDDDGHVASRDALLIINELNTHTVIDLHGRFPSSPGVANFYYDVNEDGLVTPTDALLVINSLNAAPQNGLHNAALARLVNGLYGDGQLTRSEMIQVLRSAGSDGIVDATELTDFRFLVASNSPFAMPTYVRELARDVVGSSPANRTFRGHVAGDLAAGSSSTLLNNLVDKWFLGADDPIISDSRLSYQTASGSLFNGTPSRADARQGMLGDCYFIASLAAIADENPDAVRNLFIDNGDGTYTVRFYAGALGSFDQNGLVSSGFLSGSGTADYVTVSRRLPANTNGTLGYSGYGLNASSPMTTLWVALAEKAYAQWNETGNSGRDGTNRYAAIEGGWMFDVNAQILGYNSTSYFFSSAGKQSLVDALRSNKAVTLGTTQSGSAGGLYGGHAYVVSGYDASTDSFSLHNPWGVSHPTRLTWAQLQSNCSVFVVVDPTGAAKFNSSVAVTASSDLWMSQWTEVSQGQSSVATFGSPEDVQLAVQDRTQPAHGLQSIATGSSRFVAEQIDSVAAESRTPVGFHLKANTHRNQLEAALVDLVLSGSNLDDVI